MSPRKVSRKLSAAIAATGAAGLVAAGLVLGSGTSGAVPVSLSLTYTCPFPLIGNQQVAATINADLPESVAVGEETGPIAIQAVATVPETATQGLNLVGAKNIEGTGEAQAAVAAPGAAVDVSVPVTVEKTAIPASGSFTVNASGQAPSITFPQPGTATIDVGDLGLTLTPTNASGGETGLGTFDSACVLDPGQDTTLHTLEVTGGVSGQHDGHPHPEPTTPPTSTQPPAPTTPPTTTQPPAPTLPPGGGTVDVDFGITGSSTLPRLGGTVQLVGGVSATANLDNGTYTGSMTLEKTKGDFLIVGALPATAEIDFEPVGDITGKITDGAVAFNTKLYVKLTNVSVFGLPIYFGDTCKTQEPADINLASSGAFDPVAGGQVTGKYSLTRADGCGPLNDFIGPFVFSQNNSVDITLSGK
ncbi:DUF6801 domain-containing protein [Actinokineospora pegani]|uniref:DUF6801 domain-containing protein n=1 Tax=Actinokineospora pegani TaxID=2654637 RepID=UPI0018D4CC33|nr:DUF6801 domain-containing protein [Actinokineospora pegani]